MSTFFLFSSQPLLVKFMVNSNDFCLLHSHFQNYSSFKDLRVNIVDWDNCNLILYMEQKCKQFALVTRR